MNNFYFVKEGQWRTEEKEVYFYEIEGFVAGENPECGY